jgi:hypothetical protein
MVCENTDRGLENSTTILFQTSRAIQHLRKFAKSAGIKRVAKLYYLFAKK